MFSLTYVSSAVKPLDAPELRELLRQSSTNNRPREVTGMLLYKDGNFMQVLEGEEATVRAVHEVIARDPRHRGLITLLQGVTAGREFASWSMGFRDLGAGGTPGGYSEFLNTPLTGEKFTTDPSKARKLLQLFKAQR